MVYKSGKYYILIQLEYDKETELYELKSCKEAFYNVDYTLEEDSLASIQVGLIDWREMIVTEKAPPKRQPREVINTTHFSASLDCNLYDWNKENYENAVKQMQLKYPNGIPINDEVGSLYHIVTYHIEDKPVPYSPLLRKEPGVTDCPIGKPHKTARRRGDLK